MVSKSRVAGTYGMPEGAEMVLSSFELEVGPPIEAQQFRLDLFCEAWWLLLYMNECTYNYKISIHAHADMHA